MEYYIAVHMHQILISLLLNLQVQMYVNKPESSAVLLLNVNEDGTISTYGTLKLQSPIINKTVAPLIRESTKCTVCYR